MRIVRSLLAVLCGFVVFFTMVRMMAAFAGNGPDTSGAYVNGPVMHYLVVSLIWTVAGAMLAGYVTARVAGSHEFPHAAALGLLMVLLSFLSMRQQGISQPGWYQTTVAGCGPISAMLGAAVRMLTKGRGAALPRR